jgi:uncharacterized membrane protein YozB (DUF420 family)
MENEKAAVLTNTFGGLKIRYGFVILGALALAFALFGFGRTYLLPMANGDYSGQLYLHIHGAVFFLWLILGVIQPMLIQNRKTSVHRKVGYFGFALGVLMVFIGLYVAFARVKFHIAGGAGESAKAFLLIPITDMILFATFIALAFRNVKNPQAHKRYIILSTLSILPAAFGRIFQLFTWWTENEWINSLLAISVMECTLYLGIAFDAITRRKVHPVYLWGGLIIIGVHLFRDPLSHTGWWLLLSEWLLANVGFPEG